MTNYESIKVFFSKSYRLQEAFIWIVPRLQWHDVVAMGSDSMPLS